MAGFGSNLGFVVLIELLVQLIWALIREGASRGVYGLLGDTTR